MIERAQASFDKVSLDILLAVSSLGGRGRYGEIYRAAARGEARLFKQTFQNKLNRLKESGLIKHKKIAGKGLGESWWILSHKAKRRLASMSRPPWSDRINSLNQSLKNGKISDADRLASIEKNVESLLESAFEETRYFILLAGLEKNKSERELLNIYIVENLLGGLIRPIVTLLNEQIPNEKDMPDNWKKVLYAHRSGNLRLVPDEGGTQLSSD